MDFWLGTHRPNWLERTDVPLMVSHRTLGPRKRLPKALGPWTLDSGGFTELSMHGKWVTSPADYIRAVHRYQLEVGRLRWAAPQDWMCEPFMLERTGRTIGEHQEATVWNVLLLQAAGLPVIPVLQGWEVDDYRRCLKMYNDAGVDMDGIVGVGSVCRRQNMDEASHIMRALAAEGLQLHGFGFKLTGIRRCRDVLASADSMAWSFRARRGGRHPECRHKGACGNCLAFALRWRDQVVRMDDQEAML